ncbi:glycoside hydrolase family 2 TIM barrel-domain containing protein [Pelagicoccus sp. SDUM812003]|uniref:glycoside hydrolase family 2 TIM barrel-domain containing protein n=1 Tax=Pelagicoccus sp. SDUM812003 TaxID=3041267 RepID=UPI00280FE1EB|nr:glycoside hydrolase family 2 TIM barrel-domain containing protein [Pelagicoccus sp. SDUM812003]MDQ8201924.1 glycoside hydrolase family 2 TIM barrel-domain containing protein [Pelagicoccus sp. SDUM812003]
MTLFTRTLIFAASCLASQILLAGDPQLLDDGWLFHLGELESPQAALSVDSFDGERIHMPHDWAAGGEFDTEKHGGTGKLPWQGVGWYRYELELDASDAGKRVYLDFDGAMAFPVIYLNGEEVGSWDYGYTPFRIDISDAAKFGESNVLAVKLDTRKWSSRWYPGAGLYRDVFLSIENPVHLAHWGLSVSTDGDELLGLPAKTAMLGIEIENHSDTDQSLTIEASILSPDGKTLASQTLSSNALSGATTHREVSLEVETPRLWDVDDPALHTAVVKIMDAEGTVLDQKEERFGFRTFAFTADDGFHLNGRRVQLYGVNLHSDLGPIGMAYNSTAMRRQLEIMMEMGVNAIRASHNPPAKDFLRLCDELGLVVWDEVFDKWAWTAGRDDFDPPLPGFAFRQIENTMRRDRNHPSVVVWSFGNEVGGGDEGEGVTPARAAMMAGFMRNVDDTRPIGMACHIPSLVDGENFASMDLAGWNYARRYARYREVWPEKPIIYSESASAVSTRGYYDPEFPSRPADYGDGYKISSYDLNAAFWSDVVDVEFDLMEKDSYVAGEFVWTGFDYIGEPTPHDAESRSSYFGIVDLCGFPKDRFYLYRSHWRDDVNTVHILPHWNWEGREGQNVPVFVYTNGDSAELFLNGKSLGKRVKGNRPERSPNLALEGKAFASSGAEASKAIDSDLNTAWTASPEDETPSWTIELPSKSAVRTIQLETSQKEHLFAYHIQASTDGENWQTIVEKAASQLDPWQGTQRILHHLDAQAKWLRLTFHERTGDAIPGLADFRVYDQPTTNDYYDITYDYRLRWDQVSYQPGTLKAVAYKDGKRIGVAKVETTGKPVALRLSADRKQLQADGKDLAFVTVEAVDAKGRVCPLADNLVTIEVSGAGAFEASGNGDPHSFVSFSSPTRELFYGKALAIVRPEKGESGKITVSASSDGLATATLDLTTR